MRTLAVVTSGRADYGICRPLLRQIQAAGDCRLRVYACGMHLSPEFGMTVHEIEADGFPVDERIEMLLSSDAPGGIAKSIGLGVLGFADVFSRSRPDLLVVVGDRFEILSAAVAALPFRIPLAHVHGGESTQGAIDEAIRHSLTKMSHVHFVAAEPYRARVIQMGEAPWRVVVCGAPALDNLRRLELPGPTELAASLGLPLTPPPLLVTFHPVTLEFDRTPEQVEALLGALDDIGRPVVFTYPNADTGGRSIIGAIDQYVARQGNARVAVALGTRNYFALMKHADAMVGNSSSGIVEAASFGLPVVNVGTRQHGRVRGRNVVDVACTRAAIADGIRRATQAGFRASLAGMTNPYGDGTAAERIVQVLQTVPLDERLLIKEFHDLNQPGVSE